MDDNVFFYSMIGLGFAVCFLFFILAYVIGSLLLMKVFKAARYEHPGYAWIPFYNAYILADILSDGLEKVHVLCFDVPKNVYKWLWLIVSAVSLILSSIPILGGLLSLAIEIIFSGDQNARTFSLLSGKDVESETGLGIAAAFIPLIYLVFVVAHRLTGTEQVRYREKDVVGFKEVDNSGYGSSFRD